MRTTIMLPDDLKRRATAEARKLAILFADFVRQAVTEKLPGEGQGVDRLKRRRRDPLFRLVDSLPLVQGDTATDTAERHDDYLCGDAAFIQPDAARGCDYIVLGFELPFRVGGLRTVAAALRPRTSLPKPEVCLAVCGIKQRRSSRQQLS